MAHFLTTTSTLQCPHGGAIESATRNTKVRARGQFVLRWTDTFTVAGCSYTIGTTPHPCVRVQWDVHAQRHKAHGDFSLTEDSVGYCLAGDGAMQGSAVVSSCQVR